MRKKKEIRVSMYLEGLPLCQYDAHRAKSHMNVCASKNYTTDA